MEGKTRMSAIGLQVATRPLDWAGLATLMLLTAGIVAYAVFIIGRRALLAVRAGWAGARAHWEQLVGLVCGIVGCALVVLDLTTGWLAMAHSTAINWHAHQWTSMPIIVCGFIVTWTEPGRPYNVHARTLVAKARAQPRQALAGFLLGTATWGLFPLSAALAAALPIPMLFVWPALMLAEIAVAIWWWRRHGRIEELTYGQRTLYLPSFVTHPVLWGWLWGMAATLLFWATLAQMRKGL